jgi:hypothetical protein
LTYIFLKSRSKAIKLASQEEYNTERFKLATANLANCKKEITQLEAKKLTLQTNLSKQEYNVQVSPSVLLLPGSSNFFKPESPWMESIQYAPIYH